MAAFATKLIPSKASRGVEKVLLAVMACALVALYQTANFIAPIIVEQSSRSDVEEQQFADDHNNKADVPLALESSDLLPPLFLPEQLSERIRQYLEDAIRPRDNRTTIAHPLSVPPLSECPVTEQVRIDRSNASRWILHTLDSQGRPKTVGGDEMFVTYTDNENPVHYSSKKPDATLAAFVNDQDDGTYVLDFRTTTLYPRPRLSGSGTLTVYLHYTCGMGAMDRPLKDDWRSGGILLEQFWTARNVAQPPFSYFVPPRRNEIDFTSFHNVLFVGDSLLKQLWAGFGAGGFCNDRAIDERLLRAPTTASCSISYGVVRSGLNTTYVDKFVDTIGKELNRSQHNHTLDASQALVVGTSVWDVLHTQTPLIEDHVEACRRFIEAIRERFPNVTLFWKSATSFHMEHLFKNRCLDGDEMDPLCRNKIRYMSQWRIRRVYEVQQELMKELNVTVLDLYESHYLASGHPRRPGDAVHMKSEMVYPVIASFWVPNDARRVLVDSGIQVPDFYLDGSIR